MTPDFAPQVVRKNSGVIYVGILLSDSEIALRSIAHIKRNRIMNTNGSIGKSRSDKLGGVTTRRLMGKNSRSSDTVPRQ